MKYLLVPTDFSDTSFLGADAAMAIAPQMGATVCFFSSIPGKREATFFEAHPGEEGQLPLQLQVHFETLRQRYTASGVPIRLVYTHDSLIHGMEAFAKQEDITMIIMGSSGAVGLKSIFGSNAQRVVNRLTIPVLVVKQARQSYDFKEIVFASDFRREAQAPFKQLVTLAENFGSHIHLLAVSLSDATKVEDYLTEKKMKAFEAMCGSLPVTRHKEGDVDIKGGIKLFANVHNPSVVAMVSHGEPFFQRLFKGGSITEALVNELEQPILTLSTEA